MNELIKVNYENEKPTVLGRDLHEFLEVESNYTTWFNRMTEYGFDEEKDFIPFSEETNIGRPSINHQITLDMAKEISMIQRTQKGKEARQYFIECEKKLKEQLKPMTIEDLIILQANSMKELKMEVSSLKEEHKTIREGQKAITDKIDVIADSTEITVDNWRTETRRIVYLYSQKKGCPYEYAYQALYKILEYEAGCNLATRKQNLETRLMNQGMNKSEIQKRSTKLDVIENDEKLRRMFTHILRDVAIKLGLQD